jgi:hypothetical protein
VRLLQNLANHDFDLCRTPWSVRAEKCGGAFRPHICGIWEITISLFHAQWREGYEYLRGHVDRSSTTRAAATVTQQSRMLTTWNFIIDRRLNSDSQLRYFLSDRQHPSQDGWRLTSHPNTSGRVSHRGHARQFHLHKHCWRILDHFWLKRDPDVQVTKSENLEHINPI